VTHGLRVRLKHHRM